MHLPDDTIRALAIGCCGIRREEKGLRFDRMSDALWGCYGESEARVVRAASPAGVRLRFRSDTRRMGLALRYGRQARPIFSADLLVDGRPAASVGPDVPERRWEGEVFRAPTREMRTFELWLPYVVETWLERLEIEDGARIEPAPAPEKTWLAAGDSITQGMTASSPSRTYTGLVARRLHIDLWNVGVGGGTMDPAVGEAAARLPCDLSTVAFGVNDWNRARPLDRFRRDAEAVLSAFAGRENGGPVFVITPLPVVGLRDRNDAGLTLEHYREALREAAESLGRVGVIEGPELVPAAEEYFVDGVHPNDAGMHAMASGLTRLLGKV